MSDEDSITQAVHQGLLKFAVTGEKFPGRNGKSGNTYLLNLRGAISNVPLRGLIVGELLAACKTWHPEVEVIAGVSKAGVPWASMLALTRNCPAAVIHLDGPRASGLQRQVEGDVQGKRCIVVDNVLRSGESICRAIRIAEVAGAHVVGALTIACQGAPPALPVRTTSIWTSEKLLESAYQLGLIDFTTFSTAINEEQRHEA